MVSDWMVKAIAGLAIGLSAGYLFLTLQNRAYESGKNEVMAQWAEDRTRANEAARVLEQTWRDRVDQARKERDETVQEIKDGSARVAANSDRLHRAAIAAERNACKAATGASGRESPGSVLTDVLNSVGERTSALAEYADELRGALTECRGSWPE